MQPGQMTPSESAVDQSAKDSPTQQSLEEGQRIVKNFFVMSILFGANHGTIVSCVSLATARLGSIGALEAGIMYLFYTLSALLGASYVVRRIGSRNAMIFGMSFYCIYIACFAATIAPPEVQHAATSTRAAPDLRSVALVGSAFGGIGVGILWVGQGAYFVQAATSHAAVMSQDVTVSTPYLAGIFGFVLLSFEALLRALSSVLIFFLSWRAIFGIYSAISIVTTIVMSLAVVSYPDQEDSKLHSSVFNKLTGALQLLATDRKMKHMIGVNLLFGFGGAFMNSYINGQVVPSALADFDSHFIGVLTSWTALVAGLLSLATAMSSRKGPVMMAGVACFFFIAFSFLVQPEASLWNIYGLVTIFTLQGIGRAAFESTLKAVFADFFPSDSVGAFSNLILQNGIASSLGYVLTYRLFCDDPSRYCVVYTDGTMHNVFTFPFLICISGIVAVLGYWRASVLYRREEEGRGAELKVCDEGVDA